MAGRVMEGATVRPRAALAFLGAAILVAGGLVVATVGWYIRVTTESGSAVGEEARLAFVGCPEAGAVLAARLADYGIPATGEGLTFDVRLPGRMADERAHMPDALTAPGVVAVAIKGVPTHVVVESVGMQLAFSGTPVTLLMLTEPLSEQGVTVTLDGHSVEVEEVTGAEIQIAARAGQSDEALRLASDRAVAIRHPLPCVVTAIPLGK